MLNHVWSSESRTSRIHPCIIHSYIQRKRVSPSRITHTGITVRSIITYNLPGPSIKYGSYLTARGSRWCFRRAALVGVAPCCPSAPAPSSAEAHSLRGWRNLLFLFFLYLDTDELLHASHNVLEDLPSQQRWSPGHSLSPRTCASRWYRPVLPREPPGTEEPSERCYRHARVPDIVDGLL